MCVCVCVCVCIVRGIPHGVVLRDKECRRRVHDPPLRYPPAYPYPPPGISQVSLWTIPQVNPTLTLLQKYCMTTAQYTTPPQPPLHMLYTIQYWQWQYRVKTNPPILYHLGPTPPVSSRPSLPPPVVSHRLPWQTLSPPPVSSPYPSPPAISRMSSWPTSRLLPSILTPPPAVTGHHGPPPDPSGILPPIPTPGSVHKLIKFGAQTY